MQTTDIIWHNGKLIPWDDAKIHVLTHTLHYGGGAFEGIRFYKTPNGPAIFRLEEHIDRFIYSTNAIKMPLTYSKETITAGILEIARLSNLEEGYIRPLAYYGYGKMGVNPRGNPAEVMIACWPWGAYLPHEKLDVKTSSYIRIHPNSTKVDAKLCGHYVNGILASLELEGTHYHEALFLDSDQFISEGVGENFFMVKEGIIYTPKLGTILAGITRHTVMTLAKQLGFTLVETNLTLQDAYTADEAFFTGTAAEVSPIHSIDDKVIGLGKPGPITTQIKNAYHQLVRGELTEYKHYLTYFDARCVTGD